MEHKTEHMPILYYRRREKCTFKYFYFDVLACQAFSL